MTVEQIKTIESEINEYIDSQIPKTSRVVDTLWYKLSDEYDYQYMGDIQVKVERCYPYDKNGIYIDDEQYEHYTVYSGNQTLFEFDCYLEPFEFMFNETINRQIAIPFIEMLCELNCFEKHYKRGV